MSVPGVFSFVAAASNSGKTTVIEKVVRVLKKKELRVAVVKHASKGFDLQPDVSWYLNAGADTVIAAGKDKVELVRAIEAPPSLEELLKDIGRVDVILYEGFKHAAVNKIEVFRYGVSGTRPLCLDDASYLAIVSDMRFETEIPQFDVNDEKGVAEFILDRIGEVQRP
jgi:molybdopterin-guanine dinucleotide biosynthesis adapter protein